jgi:hypothetical protein
MRGNPSCSIQVREQNGAEGISFANRDSYFQKEDTTGGKVRFGTGVLWFFDWHALLLKEYDIVKLHFDVLLERRSVATLFFLYATVSAATQSASSGSVRLTKFGSEASAVAPDGTGLLPQKGRYIYEVLCSNIQKWQWPRGLNRRSFGNALRIS